MRPTADRGQEIAPAVCLLLRLLTVALELLCRCAQVACVASAHVSVHQINAPSNSSKLCAGVLVLEEYEHVTAHKLFVLLHAMSHLTKQTQH
jgi:hypothetical protein